MLRPVVLLLVVLSLLVAACGGDDGGDESSSSTPSTASTTASADVDFPSGEGKTIRALRADLPEDAVFAPAMATLRVGKNRFAFALFDKARKQLEPEAVAVYFAESSGRRLRGPFVARKESLAVKPQFMSQQTQADLEDVQTFFVTEVDLPRRGKYTFTALAQLDGKMIASSQLALQAGERGGPPDVGDDAVKTHTETIEDAGGNIETIDTRIPPLPELHEKDLFDVLGKEPVVLMFATPQLCQTRVCGPVVDVGAEVRSRYPEPVYIHQEIWQENDINKGPREPVADYRLASEPWVFLIDKSGTIVERFEGALSVRELEEAVGKLK